MAENKAPESKGGVTAEQIEQWKQKHGGVYALEGDELTVYCRQPNRSEMARFVKEMQRDLYRASQNLLVACLLSPSMEELNNLAKDKPGLILSLAGELTDM